MVLVMISHIPCQVVQGSVVAVGLLALDEGVVFTDEVPSHGVEAHTEQGASNQVDQCPTTCRKEVRFESASDI